MRFNFRQNILQQVSSGLIFEIVRFSSGTCYLFCTTKFIWQRIWTMCTSGEPEIFARKAFYRGAASVQGGKAGKFHD